MMGIIALKPFPSTQYGQRTASIPAEPYYQSTMVGYGTSVLRWAKKNPSSPLEGNAGVLW
jgi:hypothetical protein